MAARSNKVEHNLKTREKIQASQLVNLLQDQLLKDNNKTELSANKVKMAEILLRKVMPDLQSMDGELLMQMAGQDNLNPEELQRQVAASIASNPKLLTDILRSDEQARQAVYAIVDTLRAEQPKPKPIELPEHATPQ